MRFLKALSVAVVLVSWCLFWAIMFIALVLAVVMPMGLTLIGLPAGINLIGLFLMFVLDIGIALYIADRVNSPNTFASKIYKILSISSIWVLKYIGDYLDEF